MPLTSQLSFQAAASAHHTVPRERHRLPGTGENCIPISSTPFGISCLHRGLGVREIQFEWWDWRQQGGARVSFGGTKAARSQCPRTRDLSGSSPAWREVGTAGVFRRVFCLGPPSLCARSSSSRVIFTVQVFAQAASLLSASCLTTSYATSAAIPWTTPTRPSRARGERLLNKHQALTGELPDLRELPPSSVLFAGNLLLILGKSFPTSGLNFSICQ